MRHLTIERYLQQHRQSSQLIDVREADEYQRSRIPGAIHIGSRDELLQYAQQNPDTPLVLYCSVGVRSSRAAQFLQDHGIEKVSNLDGSIFQWSNEGRALVDDKGTTEEVHPYSWIWGARFLTPRPTTDK